MSAGEGKLDKRGPYTTNRQRCRTAQPAQESKRHQLPGCLSKTTAQVPREVKQIRQLQYDDTPIDLRQRAKKERANGVGKYEDTERELRFNFVGDVKVLTDRGQRRRDHGRGDGRHQGEA